MKTLRTVLLTLAAVFVAFFFIGLATEVAPQPQPATAAPTTAPAPQTVTETRTVEVPVPTLPDACRDYLDQVDAVTAAIVSYEQTTGAAGDNLRTGLEALVMGDPDLINRAIEAHLQMQNDSTGPLQTIMYAQRDLTIADAACNDAIGD